ncbi:MAG TPA: hypothetical protein VLH75_12225 [Longimicrobiales bacterium]|nr:hypothetical protein [Longimicrobiales bacterium]
MNARKLGAILLIVAGTAGLVFGTFSYRRNTQVASIGSMEIEVSEQRAINVPVWAGVGAILVGTALLFVGKQGKA